MRTQRLVTASIAALVLAVSVGAASANKLSFSNRNFRITWNSFTMVSEGFEVECVVTVEGTLHSSTIVKTRDMRIGHITRANVGRCGGAGRIYALNGSEVLLGRAVGNTLPWEVDYEGFTGRLPTPGSVVVSIPNAAFLVEIFGFNCLYRSTNEHRWLGQFLINGEGRVAGFVNIEGAPFSYNEGERLFCPEEISPVGTGGVQLLGLTASIFIRLI